MAWLGLEMAWLGLAWLGLAWIGTDFWHESGFVYKGLLVIQRFLAAG